jgi:hypothetical protein
VLFYVFLLSGEKKVEKSRAKSYREMVMPDVMCAANNNKAIHHLNMCFCDSRHCSLSLPSANFRHYLIEKGFSLCHISLYCCDVSTTFCALMMLFSWHFLRPADNREMMSF